MKVFILLIPILCSCRSVKSINDCSKEAMIARTDAIVKKNGYRLKELKREIREDDTSYSIVYSPLDSLKGTRGNEAVIKINKTNCEVLEIKLYE